MSETRSMKRPIPPPEPRIEDQSEELVVRAKSITRIESAGDYKVAESVIRDIRAMAARIKDHHAPIIKANENALKVAREARDGLLRPLEAADRALRASGAEFLRLEDRRRQEATAKLLAQDTRREEKSIERQAKNLEKAGQSEAAAAVRAQPVNVAPVVIPDPEGAREYWKHEVIDAALLPREWMIPNEKGLAAFAKATKGATAIPGVRFFKEIGMAVRG